MRWHNHRRAAVVALPGAASVSALEGDLRLALRAGHLNRQPPTSPAARLGRRFDDLFRFTPRLRRLYRCGDRLWHADRCATIRATACVAGLGVLKHQRGTALGAEKSNRHGGFLVATGVPNSWICDCRGAEKTGQVFSAKLTP